MSDINIAQITLTVVGGASCSVLITWCSVHVSVVCIYTHIRGPVTSSADSSLESNWQKICSSSFLITLARTFKRPLKDNKRHERVGVRVSSECVPEYVTCEAFP